MESEYKDKSLQLDYFVELGSSLVALLKEKPINAIFKDANSIITVVRNPEREAKVADELVKLAKDLQKVYRNKFSYLKGKKMYDILEDKTNTSVLGAKSFRIADKDLNDFNSNNLLSDNLRLSHDSKFNMLNNTLHLSRDNIYRDNNYMVPQNGNGMSSQLRPLTERYTDNDDNENLYGENVPQGHLNINNNNPGDNVILDDQDNQPVNIFDILLDGYVMTHLQERSKDHIRAINDFIFSEAEKIDGMYTELEHNKVRI